MKLHVSARTSAEPFERLRTHHLLQMRRSGVCTLMNPATVLRGPQARALECGSVATAFTRFGMARGGKAAAPLSHSTAGSARRGHKVALGSDT